MMPPLRDTHDIQFVAGFVAEPQRLYDWLVANVPWDTRFRARQSASFGVPYNYSGVTWPEPPWSDELLPLRERLSAHLGYECNNCLANYYPDEHASMGYHADATDDLEPGTGIAIVSLGAERTLTFRNQIDRTQLEHYPLPSGSLLFMTADLQSTWKHALLPTEEPTPGRISLTFRRLRV